MCKKASRKTMPISCEQASVISAYEVQTTFETEPERGLSHLEADSRRNHCGLNELPKSPPDPLWKKYLDQFNNPFILLLFASAVISVFMRQFDDAISISVAIIIVVTVGFVQEYRSEKTLDQMSALLPPVCNCLRDGHPESILAKYLVPGDIVQLAVGDRIPADLRLIHSAELAIDESSFTGETEPVFKSAQTVGRKIKMAYSDMTNICFMGTLVCNGTGTGVVICTGADSQFGEVFKMMQAEEPPRTPLQKSMDKLGKQLSIYSLLVIGMIMLIGYFQNRPMHEMFNVGVSLAVAAIPEGLPIVVTVTLALGVMRMANRRAIIKRLPTVEALGCVDVVCSDKTGTLTSNEMTVSNIETPSAIFAVADHGTDHGSDVIETESRALVETGIICNNAFFTNGKWVGTPTEAAILVFAEKLGIAGRREAWARVRETPFSSEKKYMMVTCQDKSGTVMNFVKGALEVVLDMCSSVSVSGMSSVMTEEMKRRLQAVEHEMGGKGLRVLALCRGDSLANFEFMGLIGLHDPPRSGVLDSISVLQSSGVRVAMITGDSRETAGAIAASLGIMKDGKTMLSGHDIDQMTDRDLEEISERVGVYFRSCPRHKVRIVKALQALGHVVGMTGDGVNDGVAIKKADVGISMGVSGTDVCKEAADMILLDDDFSTILSAVEEGKCIFYNIRNFVRFQLSTSIAALMLISLSTMFDIPNPLNPMQILWINVIMDGPPAQSLGVEPVDHEVLKRPPRKQTEPILTRALLWNILLSASIIITGTLWIFKEMMEDGKITARDTTMTFTCFVFFDMFNALTCRSQNRLIFEIGFFSNKVFCVAVGFSILGQLAVIYLPPLQYVFQTESLSLEDLMLLLCLSSSVFVISEAKKFFERYSILEAKYKCRFPFLFPGRTNGKFQNGGGSMKRSSPYAV